MIDDKTLERAMDCIVNKEWTFKATASILNLSDRKRELEEALKRKYPWINVNGRQTHMHRSPHLT